MVCYELLINKIVRINNFKYLLVELKENEGISYLNKTEYLALVA